MENLGNWMETLEIWTGRVLDELEDWGRKGLA